MRGRHVFASRYPSKVPLGYRGAQEASVMSAADSRGGAMGSLGRGQAPEAHVSHRAARSDPELRLLARGRLTRGRVGWNIVTSYLPGAARNLGLDDLPDHDSRYDLADDYLDVVYKLWEASWDDGAGGQLWKARPGEAPQQLTTDPGEYLHPAWSPDGRFLVAAFHPELTADTRLHALFLDLVREGRLVRA